MAGAHPSWNTPNFSIIFICLFKQSIWVFFPIFCYKHDSNQPQLTQQWNHSFSYCTYLPHLISAPSFLSNVAHSTVDLFFPSSFKSATWTGSSSAEKRRAFYRKDIQLAHQGSCSALGRVSWGCTTNCNCSFLYLLRALGFMVFKKVNGRQQEITVS